MRFYGIRAHFHIDIKKRTTLEPHETKGSIPIYQAVKFSRPLPMNMGDRAFSLSLAVKQQFDSGQN
jgi:hypothetical protein